MYTPELFAAWREPSANAARAVVPTIAAIVKPASVIDIGCGTGSWLAAFGLDDVLGADAYVPNEALEIPLERFVRTDLTSVFSAGRSFDLALSVEVGEHLPVEAAPLLVQTLVGHSPAVVFRLRSPARPAPATSTDSGLTGGPVFSPNMVTSRATVSDFGSGTTRRSRITTPKT
jgi:SAM-dependent methyltransferase